MTLGMIGLLTAVLSWSRRVELTARVASQLVKSLCREPGLPAPLPIPKMPKVAELPRAIARRRP